MQNTKTFRLFISSTFNDFKKERQILHEKVFPSIDIFLFNNYPEYTFQPIDLRWGVNEEAQLDQKTLEVCLNEVKACKHYLHPNFLIMSGNRYGWVPLPYAIERNEFESIINFYRMHKDKSGLKLQDYPRQIKVLKTWYKKDTNHLMNKGTSYAYVLKERDRKSVYKDWKKWEKVENDLRDILQTAVTELFKEDSKTYNKYFLSATEAETEEGIFSYMAPTEYQKDFIQKEDNIFELDKQYVFAFIRDIKNTVKPKNVIKFQEQLTDTLLSSNILSEVSQLGVDNTNISEVYLKKFEVFMKEKLQAAIVTQINIISTSRKSLVPNKITKQALSLLINEKKEQEGFKYSRSKSFVGREEILNKISDYINTPISTPIVLYGESGMGKSALMAKSIDIVSKNNTVYYRFVGVTDYSSNCKSLLVSLFDELQENNIIPSVGEYKTDINAFHSQLNSILKNQLKEKIIIYIDALDQLLSQDYLLWLPEEFPENLKVIISILKDDNYKIDSQYYDILSHRYDDIYFINLAEYSLKDHGKELLDKFLLEENRVLTTEQIQYVLQCFEDSNYSPLYLKIAIEIIKYWKSYDIDKKLESSIHGVIGQYIDSLTETYHIETSVVEKVLNYIHASKNGLSEKELLDILSEDLNDDVLFQKSIFNEFHESVQKINPRRGHKVEYILPMAIWSRLHELLKPFLTKKGIDGYVLMKYFHRQFTTVVNERYKETQQQYHQKLSDYFLTLQNQEKNWEKRFHSLHMLDEVPYQLFHAKSSETLKEICFDLEFAGAIYDNNKQDDFKNILEKATDLEGITKDEIYLWESFYREKEYLIKYINDEEWKAHQSLFQLAYIDGKESPLACAAKILLKKKKVNFSWMKLKNSELLPYKRKGILKTLFSHTDAVMEIIDLQSQDILSASLNGEICIWNENGSLKNKVLYKDIIYPEINQLDSGKLLLNSSENGYIYLLDKRGTFVIDFTVNEDGFDRYELVSLYHDNNYVFVGQEYFWFEIRKETGEIVFIPEGYAQFGMKITNNVIFYNQINDTYEYEKTCIYNYVTEEMVDCFNDSRLDGTIFPCVKNDYFLVSNKNTYIFDKKFNCLKTYEGLHITSTITLNDSVVGFNKGNKLLYLINLRMKKELKGHEHGIKLVQVIENSNFISQDEKGHMICWDSNGDFMYEFEKVDGKVNQIKDMDNRDIVASDTSDIYVWDKSGKLINTISNLHDSYMYIKKLQKNKLYTHSTDGLIYNIDYKYNTLSNKKKSKRITFYHKINQRSFLILRNGVFEKWNLNGEKFANIMLDNIKNMNYIKILNSNNILVQSDNIVYLINLKGEIIFEMKEHTSDITNHIELENNLFVTVSYNELIIWDTLMINKPFIIKATFRDLFKFNNDSFIAITDKKVIQYDFNGNMGKEANISTSQQYKLNNFLFFLKVNTDYKEETGRRKETLEFLDLISFDLFYVLDELKDVNTVDSDKELTIVSKLDDERLLIKKHSNFMVYDVEYNLLTVLDVSENFKFENAAFNIIVGIDDSLNQVRIFDFDGNLLFKDKSLESVDFMNNRNRCIITEETIYLRGMFGSYKKWKHDGTYLGILYFPLSHIEAIFIEKDNNFLITTENDILSYKFYEK